MNICNSSTKFTFTLFFVITSVHIVFGQSTTVKGVLLDPQNSPIELASIVLLNQKDSTVVNYTITDAKGFFQIIKPTNDTLIFQASFLGYKPYYKNIIINSKILDLKTIKLKEELSTLDAVTISAVIPIQIKKDTIAFNASSFKINHDDTIESLLSKLPGVEIDSDGKVVAQGNEVSRIFVDGKEFFGGDPAVVLKNLSADAIDKVEVIDKKSDEAELTGVDDGNKEIIINFSLKKAKRKQGFGKVSGGVGLDSRYFNNLNYNRFTSKTQLSLIGKYNNINITGSNIRGFLQNTSGISGDSDEDNNTLKKKSLNGYLTTGIAGIHIGHEFKKKEAFNVDYFYNHTNNNGLSNSNRITFSNKNNYEYNSDNVFDNTSKNHNLNFNYKNKSHKTHSLAIKGGFISDTRSSLLNRKGAFLNDMNELVTTNNFNLRNRNKRQTVRLSANYYQKLNKQGRNFSTSFFINNLNTEHNNNQNAIIRRNIGKNNESNNEIMTLRDENTKTNHLNFSVSYTEPLWPRHYLKTQGSAQIKSIDEDAFQSKITATKNNAEELLLYKFMNKEYSYQTSFTHNFNSPKWFLSSGFELQDLNRSFGSIEETPLVKNQFYINPLATVHFKPKRGERHRFTYKRIIKSPRTSQITTVINDLNPYFIRRGNPNLRTEKIDKLTLLSTINNFKSSLIFYSKIQFQYAEDAIISNVTIDDDYIKIRSYENIGNTKQLNTTFSLSKKIKHLGIRYILKNKNLYATSNTMVNLELNNVTTKDYLFSLSFENYNKSKFDIKTGLSYNINNTVFSLVKDLDRKYTKQQYFSMFDYDVFKKFNINTQFDYIIFTDNKFENKQELPIWNASMSYSFSKNNNILKLVLIDLLDKNIDIYRRSTANYFEETTTESLGRYVILSYTYRLNNNKRKGKAKKSV